MRYDQDISESRKSKSRLIPKQTNLQYKVPKRQSIGTQTRQPAPVLLAADIVALHGMAEYRTLCSLNSAGSAAAPNAKDEGYKILRVKISRLSDSR